MTIEVNTDANNTVNIDVNVPIVNTSVNTDVIIGPTGATGNGIASISKTSTSGLTDTYTVTYTNGNTTTFTVTNGADGEDGQDGTNATITGATASIDGNIGTPSVIVTSGGTESARSFNFAFSNLKGQQGETGADGQDGTDGVSVTGVTLLSTIGLQKTYRMSFSNGTHFDYVVTDGSSGAVAIDNSTITKNINDELQASSLVGLTASITELNYTDGVTSNIQTQLNNKISSITSSMVTTALGYTPYNSTNPSGYQTSAQVSSAITAYHDSTKQNVATYDSTNERLVL